jgi:hypothetical protein
LAATLAVCGPHGRIWPPPFQCDDDTLPWCPCPHAHAELPQTTKARSALRPRPPLSQILKYSAACSRHFSCGPWLGYMMRYPGCLSHQLHSVMAGLISARLGVRYPTFKGLGPRFLRCFLPSMPLH